jgi:hypothetical protein
VRESDLRVLFKRQAAIELASPPISIPAVRRIGRARVFRRRAGAFGSPVLAAAAVVAVVLAGPFAAGPRHPATTLGGPAAPRTFNPLVPYAAVTWYPYRPSLVSSLGWHSGLLLRASSRSPANSTEVVLYAAGWCTLRSASLSCGSTPSGTSVEMTVRGQAPDVQGQPAYWTRYAGGALAPLRPLSGTQMLAFQYARGGWAVVESTGTPADVLRVAASVRYGQTSPLRFPFRLTGLPRAWSEVLAAGVTQAGPGAQAPTGNVLLLGSPATRLGTAPHNTLTILISTRPTTGPTCQTRTNTAAGQTSTSQPGSCPSEVINGYRVFLNTPPAPGKQTLLSPDAGGLYLDEQTTGPDAPLTPASVLAHHLQLLGPDPANWTTAPVSP